MNKIFLSLLALISVVFISCERDEEPQGPQLLDLYGEFELVRGLSSSRDVVDFSSQTVVFSAEFNKLTQWQITITGLESGATKIISDFSREINPVNGVWNGNTTIYPIFEEEFCSVELYIPEDSLYLRDTLEIVQIRTQETDFLETFDSGSKLGWQLLPQSGGIVKVNTDSNVVQGSGNLFMGGFIEFNEFLVAQAIFPAQSFGNATYGLPENPNDVYFNVMFYMPAANDLGLVLFNFYEDDNSNEELLGEDVYGILLNNADFEKGWNIVSINYGSLRNPNGGETAVGAGNNILEPSKLAQIEILYLHPPEVKYSEIYIDYMAFTSTSGPLEL